MAQHDPKLYLVLMLSVLEPPVLTGQVLRLINSQLWRLCKQDFRLQFVTPVSQRLGIDAGGVLRGVLPASKTACLTFGTTAGLYMLDCIDTAFLPCHRCS